MQSKRSKHTYTPLESSSVSLFHSSFHSDPSIVSISPGRVNLLGEHTDYQQGYCLPVAVDLFTVCCLTPIPGTRTCTLVSLQSNPPGARCVFEIGEKPHEEWGTFVAGVVAQYANEFEELCGFNASFASDVPLGGGLSSSAALDVAVATALECALDKEKNWDPVQRALRCVQADHDFPGVPCGIMDQTVSSCGKTDHACLIDCRSNQVTLVPFHDESLCLVVCNTNIKHSHATGEYPARVRECKQAAKELGVPFLRDVLDPKRAEEITLSEVVRKRARHVISENERVRVGVEALRACDWTLFGKIMNECHASLKADFQVSCDELDFLAESAQILPGVFGARMTGGGFGGCVVALVTKKESDNLVKTFEKIYFGKFAIKCTSYIFDRPVDGARIIES